MVKQVTGLWLDWTSVWGISEFISSRQVIFILGLNLAEHLPSRWKFLMSRCTVCTIFYNIQIWIRLYVHVKDVGKYSTSSLYNPHLKISNDPLISVETDLSWRKFGSGDRDVQSWPDMADKSVGAEILITMFVFRPYKDLTKSLRQQFVELLLHAFRIAT